MDRFDPNAAAVGRGIFGLPHTPDEAQVIVVPVPFEATTSYGGGAARAPAAILAASRQVDLFDIETGRPYEAGIAMLPELAAVRVLDSEAMELVRSWRRSREVATSERPAVHGGPGPVQPSPEALQARANDLCARLNELLRSQVQQLLAAGKIVGTIGGDHGAVFGAIAAHAERHPGLGILHIDAHADLRHAYEGFEWSHASIMDNVQRRLAGVEHLVQVGVRDLCEEERDTIEASKGRIRTWYDSELARQRFQSKSWAQQVQRILMDLPEHVYVSFDIDGLDPALCPHTGAPVPGGLSFQEADYLLGAVARSGRRIVGFDLVEVAPDPAGGEWDANVGARLLYKLIGWTLRSRAQPGAAAPRSR